MPGPWGCQKPTAKTKIEVEIPMAASAAKGISINAIVQNTVSSVADKNAISSEKVSQAKLSKTTYQGQALDQETEKSLRNKEKSLPEGKPFVTVYFDFNSSILNGKASTELLIAFNALKGKTIEVHGFTDSTGSYEYNAWLAQRRADRVAEYLAKATEQSSAFGHGLCCYTSSNETLDGRAENRRVDVYVIEKQGK